MLLLRLSAFLSSKVNRFPCVCAFAAPCMIVTRQHMLTCVCGAGDRQPHCVRGARNAVGEVAAGRWQGVCVRSAAARRTRRRPGQGCAGPRQPHRRAVPAPATHLSGQTAAAHPDDLREQAAAVRRGAAAGGVLGVLRGRHIHPHAVRPPGADAGRGRPHAGAASPAPQCEVKCLRRAWHAV